MITWLNFIGEAVEYQFYKDGREVTGLVPCIKEQCESNCIAPCSTDKSLDFIVKDGLVGGKMWGSELIGAQQQYKLYLWLNPMQMGYDESIIDRAVAEICRKLNDCIYTKFSEDDDCKKVISEKKLCCELVSIEVDPLSLWKKFHWTKGEIKVLQKPYEIAVINIKCRREQLCEVLECKEPIC